MTKLSEILKHKKRLLTTEFLPPKAANLSDLVGKTLKVANVIDSVSLPELKANNHGVPKSRMNPFYAALRLRDLTGVETLFHLTPRDSNKNAVAGVLLSAAEANLQNVLVIGGDRYTSSEELTLSKNVYDFNGSTELIKGIRSLEAQVGLVESGFCIVAGADPTVIYTNEKKKIESEVLKLLERQDAGAELVQTQPVFDRRYFQFLDVAREQGLRIPVLVGILPLRSRADSIEIERRYGITIPNELKTSLGEDGEKLGRKMACELAAELVKNGVQSLHIYPRENCEFLLDVVKAAFGSDLLNFNQD